jgi:hypothetical protein
MRIKLNTTEKDEHVAQVERGICMIKECSRSSKALLSFKIIPRILQRELIKREVAWINMFPQKGGISQTMSPRTIIDRTLPDFNIHCKVPFGSYCQVHQNAPITNTQAPRTVGAIALRPKNIQGGYTFLSLETFDTV